ncbi:lysophosphatidic acid receptor 6-like [Tiliqua scincoides]|uniref:lysophosphatidic acid receptor 6-like n=1 Tax=Tiliqua scincoides TaxID=71010 RepID=UPI003462C4D1
MSANYSSGVDQAFASIYSLLFIGGLPLNIAALYFFCFGWVVHSTTTIYMKNLAVCDLLLLTSLPLRVYYYSRRPQLPQAVCDTTGLLLLVNMYSSIFLLTCISWDRCMALCFPLSRRAQAVRQQAKYICAGAWALSIVGTIPTYFVPNQKVSNRTLCFDSQPDYIRARAVTSAMVLCFALPLAIMVTCSCSLLRAVHHSTAVQMELVNGSKIKHMVMTNVAIFLGCFLPFHVTVLCYQVPALKEEHLTMAYKCALLLACANATLDPLAYYFATETFQHFVSMDHLRGTWSSRHSNTERGCSSNP